MKIGKILHALIQSMSQKERENFTKFSHMTGGYNGSHYQDLFEFYKGMRDYEERWYEKTKLAAGFRNNLPALRTKLLGMILESLRLKNARSEKSQRMEMQASLEDVRILQGRGFPEQAAKRLKKLRKSCSPVSDPLIFLQLQDLEYEILLLTPSPNLEATFVQMNQDGEKALETLRVRSVYAQLQGKLRNVAKLRGKSLMAIHPDYQPFLEDPLLWKDNPPEEFLARSVYDNCQGMLYLIQDKNVESYEVYKQSIERWEKNHRKIWDNADLYLSMVQNYLLSCLYGAAHSSQFPEAKRKIEGLKSIPPRNKLKFNRMLNYQTLQYYLNFLDEEQVDLDKIATWLGKNEDKIQISRRLAFYNNFKLLNFINEDFSQTNKWILKIEQLPGEAKKKDVRNPAKLMQLVSFFELDRKAEKSMLLDENAIRRVDRYFKKEFEAEKPESIDAQYTFAILAFFKKIINLVKGGTEFIEACQGLDEELNGIMAPNAEKQLMNDYLFIFWARTYTKKTSIKNQLKDHLNGID